MTERAFRLSIQLRSSSKVEEIKELLWDLIDPDNNDYILDAANRICHLLIELSNINPIEIAERVMLLADRFYDNFISCDFKSALLKTAEKLLPKALIRKMGSPGFCVAINSL